MRFLVAVLTPGLLCSAMEMAASERFNCRANSFAVMDMNVAPLIYECFLHFKKLSKFSQRIFLI
jgi:hypothetical protein